MTSSPAWWHLHHPDHGDKPWSVQVEALARAGDERGFGWWLEQGLGKTPLALNDFYSRWLNNEVDAALVIAPNSLKADWALAVREWGIPEEHIAAAYWPKWEVPDRLENCLVAVNYEAASRPSQMEKYLLWLLDQSRVYLIIDETSALANPTSQTTRAIIELAKRAAFVRGLNGTPWTGSVLNYYGQLRALGSLNGVNPWAFKARFAKTGGFMGKQIVGIKEERKDDLARLLDQSTFRALKADWRKDLPPKVYTVIHLDMTKRQLRHYREMMEDFYTCVFETEISADMVLVQMNKLRQISSCLVLNEGKVEWIEKPAQNPKMQACIEWVEASPGKAIVTAVYKPSVELLFQTFSKMGMNPAIIRGGMTPDEWVEQKARFNGDPSCRLLVGQQAATYRGHTLIGREGDWCSRLFSYEPDFSYYQRAQLEDRIHRGAQQETCLYTDTISSPIEARVLEVLRGKKTTAAWMDGLVASVRQRDW